MKKIPDIGFYKIDEPIEDRRDKAIKKLKKMTKDDIITDVVLLWMTDEQIDTFLRSPGEFKEWLTKAKCPFCGKEDVTAKVKSDEYKDPKTYFVEFTCYNCHKAYQTKRGLKDRQV